jgi:hypothetical protein
MQSCSDIFLRRHFRPQMIYDKLTCQNNYYITFTLLSELGSTQRTWGRVQTIYCQQDRSSAPSAYRLRIRASSVQRLKQTADFHVACYEGIGTGDYPNIVRYNFIQSSKTIWRDV